LGTDGFGRSDTRDALRRFFEIDASHIVLGTLAALARDGKIEPEVVQEVIDEIGIDPELAPPSNPERLSPIAQSPRATVS
jgi:pyruvate dehydrogenase E1 component